MSLRVMFKKIEKDKVIYTVETDGVMFNLYYNVKSMDYHTDYILSNDYEYVIKRTLQLMQEEQSLGVLKYINRNEIILTKTVNNREQ